MNRSRYLRKNRAVLVKNSCKTHKNTQELHPLPTKHFKTINKLAQMYDYKCRSIESLYYLPFKNNVTLHLNKFEFLFYTRIICVKFC